MIIKNRKLAVLGASYMAAIFIDKAKDMGIKTYCFAWKEGAIAKDHADVFYPISVMEKEEIAEICREICVDGIISTTEAPIASSGYITNRLGLNGNVINTATNITNKSWVRNQSKGCKVLKHPQYIYLKDINDLIYITEWKHFPAVVKPVNGGGKRGVIVCNSEYEFKKCIEYAFACDQKKSGILVEEYITQGKEYSVESLSYKGKHSVIQITEKISSGPPHCVELGHHQPAFLTEKQRKNVYLAIQELLDSVSFSNGPTHTEIKISNGEIFLIELNARPGGDHIATTLTPLSTGYDYVGNSIKVALGVQPEKVDRKIGIYSGVYFITKQTEFLKPVFDTCDNEDWLYEKHVENDNLNELTHNDCTHTNYMIYYSDRRIEI